MGKRDPSQIQCVFVPGLITFETAVGRPSERDVPVQMIFYIYSGSMCHGLLYEWWWSFTCGIWKAASRNIRSCAVGQSLHSKGWWLVTVYEFMAEKTTFSSPSGPQLATKFLRLNLRIFRSDPGIGCAEFSSLEIFVLISNSNSGYIRNSQFQRIAQCCQMCSKGASNERIPQKTWKFLLICWKACC